MVQVGTQQRSDHNRVFLLAVAMVRDGRIGKIRKVTASIGGGPTGGPFPAVDPPAELNWDMWLGQAPKVAYRKNRCHADFRWWYEYSGGKLTDWGAHHVDIGQWAIGMENSGPNTIEVVKGALPVEFKGGYPTAEDRYNTATEFLFRARFAGGVVMDIRHDLENGVKFEGSSGAIFVTRDRIDLDGGAVNALYKNPVPESLLKELRKGKTVDGHMANFFECIRDRSVPVSDVWSHHRALTTCHLANIALRLGRQKLTWDPAREEIIGDSEANALLSRPQRAPLPDRLNSAMDELTEYLINTAEDGFWDQIQSEARREAEREPVLVSFLFASVLRHRKLEDGLGVILANKLQTPDLPAILLRDLINEAFAEDVSIRRLNPRRSPGSANARPRSTWLRAAIPLLQGLSRSPGLPRRTLAVGARAAYAGRAPPESHLGGIWGRRPSRGPDRLGGLNRPRHQRRHRRDRRRRRQRIAAARSHTGRNGQRDGRSAPEGAARRAHRRGRQDPGQYRDWQRGKSRRR